MREFHSDTSALTAKLVIAYGLIAGLIMAGLQWVIATLCLRGTVSFDDTTLIGYAGMVLALSIIFPGIKSYRDRQPGGTIRFWKGVKIGLLITLVASVIHALGFQLYDQLNPEFKSIFLERFVEYKLAQLPQPAASDAIEAVRREIALVKTVQENPLLDFVVSLVAMLPVGVIVTFISAAFLRKN